MREEFFDRSEEGVEIAKVFPDDPVEFLRYNLGVEMREPVPIASHADQRLCGKLFFRNSKFAELLGDILVLRGSAAFHPR